MDSTSTGPHQQPTARRSAAAPAVLLALALLLALGGCADPAPQAAQPSASASAPSSSSSRDGASGGDLCAQLPLEDLNALLDLAGDPLASTAPAADDDDGGGSSCLLTGKDPAHAYVVTVHDAPFDDVLAGRPSLDTTAGPRSAWVDADRELVQQLGERTLTVAAAQGSDVQLSEALVVAEAVTKTLP